MRIFAAFGILLVSVAVWLPGQSKSKKTQVTPSEAPPVSSAPGTEKLTYKVEWRLIRAGSVIVETKSNWGRLKLESAGLVSKLYKIDDVYAANYEGIYCTTTTVLDAIEGKRHRETRV